MYFTDWHYKDLQLYYKTSEYLDYENAEMSFTIHCRAMTELLRNKFSLFYI